MSPRLVEHTQIGKYRVVARIGQGAMGEVYKAHDPVLDRHVALKTIASTLGSNPEARLRFHREAQSVARLNHPNIVTVYDFGEEAGEVYMAMELLEGIDLRGLIASRRLGDLQARLVLMEQVCEGVGFAHGKDVVHRDLKPANIYVERGGHVKVMDFGLARIGASSVTQTGTVMGTPHYMSPEQVRGQRADARSDVFALGGILYELLTGHQPFEADSMHAVLFRILETEPEPVQRWLPDVPPAVAALTEKALAKDPRQRFANAGEMAAAVRAVRESLAAERGRSELTLTALLDGEGATRALPATSRASSALEALVDPAVPGAATVATQPGAREATLEGRAPTKLPAATRLGTAPRGDQARPPRRGALLVAALVVAAGGGALLALRLMHPSVAPPSAAPAASAEPGATAPPAPLVASERELAKQSLADRQFEAAVTHAERVLETEPNDAEARRIRAAAREALDRVQSAVTEGRAAIARGDSATASRKLDELLGLEPGHPAVRELSAELSRRVRSQAEPPRREAPVPPPSRGASLPSVASIPTMGPNTPPAPTVPAAATPLVTPPAAVPTPTVAPPTPTVPPAAPPTRVEPAPAHIVSAPAPSPTAIRPPDDQAIRELVASYARAIETKDIELFRRVKPSLSRDEERRLREALQGGEQRVSVEVLDMKIGGDTARVRLLSRYTIDGKTQKPFEQLLSLRRGPNGWVVEEIRRGPG